MKTVCNENQCTGCMACLEACSQDAITIKDDLKHYNAVIDGNKCIDCGACERVCQNNNDIKTATPIVWYQGWSKSEEQRSVSSSGGFAAELAKYFIAKGGIVCSCDFENGIFGFDFAESTDKVERFKGSKYVKSNPTGIYNKIRDYLKAGRKVLVIGLPCQIAAVKLFVGKQFKDDLYLVDLICHGTPSPKVLSLFLNEHGYLITKIRDIQFRHKGTFNIRKDGSNIGEKGVYDCYTLAFLNGLSYTENCYDCKYASCDRVSDLTIGDSWGSELDGNEIKKGISLVLCQTEKGKALLNNSNIHLESVNIEKAIEHNHQLKVPSKKPKKYDYFFNLLKNGTKFDIAVSKSLPRTWFNQQVKSVLIKLKVLRGGNLPNGDFPD